MIGKLFLITLITVQIVDISGFVTSIKKALWKWVQGKEKPYKDYSLKPLDCSYCMNFWISLAFLIIAGSFTLEYLTIILLLSWLTIYIKDFQYLIGDTIQKMINKIEDTLAQ